MSDEPGSASAANYVGRVGALAVALGIGAAVVGGAGVASADGTTGDSPSAPSAPSKNVETQRDSTAAPGHTAGSSGSVTHAPGSTGGSGTQPTNGLKAPKTQVGNGRNATTGGRGPAGLISSVPQKIADAPDPVVPGSPADEAAADQDPGPTTGLPAGGKTVTGSNQPAFDQIGSNATNDAPATDFQRRLADSTAAALRGEVQPLRASVPPTLKTIKPTAIPSESTAGPTDTADVTGTAAQATAAQAALISPTPVAPAPVAANPIATLISGFLSAIGLAPSASSTGGAPAAPLPTLLGVLQLIRREFEAVVYNQQLLSAAITSGQTTTNPSMVPAGTVPSSAEQTTTAYGDIGKWMLEPDGQISDYGGRPYDGKTLLEPVNVVIVDPRATSTQDAATRLNTAMFWSGFPAQPIHTTGFQGSIDGHIYGQEPTGPLLGYSDNLFVFPNDHGRVFGPDPVQTSRGYVWSGAFSTEQLGFDGLLPIHTYVSSNMARNALALRMISSGAATFGGFVPLENAYDTTTTTTGDHDGYAVVLVLR